MTQQETPLALAFQLSGEGVEITYLTSGQDGKPHFTYKDAEYDRTYVGDEILIQQNWLGSLVMVSLFNIADGQSVIVTLIVPRTSGVQNAAVALETLAIKCVTDTNWRPPVGAVQSYEAILLKGSVQSSIPK